MKIVKFIMLTLLVMCGKSAFTQSELASGYYVVVAAYDDSREDYAKRFTEKLKSKGHTALYGLNSSRNLFFVYLSYFSELKPSLVEMKSVRQKGEFTDAWVRVVSGDIISKITLENSAASESIVSVGQQANVEVKSAGTPSSEVGKETGSEQATMTADEKDEPMEKQEPNPVQVEVDDKGVFLSLFYGTNNRVVDGEVQVIDTERSRVITKAKGNDYFILPDPKSKSGQLTLTCEVFGYRKVQHELNYPLTLMDTTKDYVGLMGATVSVMFDLVRYRKGDIQTLFNVYFFNDAAVMLPESRYELNSLLGMMNENSNYRIKLHGHSNGNYHGKILGLGSEKNFFSMDGVTQSTGSAKDLSGKRAETVKEFLISNGISANRVEVKAWGGKKPLYDKHSANAKKNVRVEVEVLEE